MLLRSGRSFYFECDECGDSLDTGTGVFQEARDYLKDYEWRTEKVGDVWCHYCLACTEALR